MRAEDGRGTEEGRSGWRADGGVDEKVEKVETPADEGAGRRGPGQIQPIEVSPMYK